jgi:hypothetical protein
MSSNKEPEIVEKELWDHYSELPNPSWYEYIADKDNWIYVDEYRRRKEDNSVHQLYISGEWKNIQLGIEDNETFCKTKV